MTFLIRDSGVINVNVTLSKMMEIMMTMTMSLVKQTPAKMLEIEGNWLSSIKQKEVVNAY